MLPLNVCYVSRCRWGLEAALRALGMPLAREAASSRGGNTSDGHLRKLLHGCGPAQHQAQHVAQLLVLISDTIARVLAIMPCWYMAP